MLLSILFVGGVKMAPVSEAEYREIMLKIERLEKNDETWEQRFEGYKKYFNDELSKKSLIIDRILTDNSQIKESLAKIEITMNFMKDSLISNSKSMQPIVMELLKLVGQSFLILGGIIGVLKFMGKG